MKKTALVETELVKSALGKTALVLAAALLAAGTARAALVTVDYAVPIAAIAEEYLDPYSYEEVGTTFLGGIQASVGDVLTGRFTYDDAAPLAAGFGGYFTQVVSHSVSFDLIGATITLDNSLLITSRTAAADGLGLNGSGNIGGETDPLAVVDFAFAAPAGTHAPETLPSAADWQHYGASSANPFRMTIHGLGYNAYLTGGEMQFSVSAVPEPATAAMLLAGLATVAAARLGSSSAMRRRKAIGA
ncbi:PEP-CTERM sorting domain-containing protein [Pseudoduganella albidiflava]|uniref:PEP-CTERM sorting domain-containing protein n=1 Tax=Pseudoduganella albidiflava TaxID=321983 RepID=A0A411WUY7_9BURK|nr:PEP-CTERM sorting domain-containing protein [Pseudoduganella albidiflava]QBI00307.1 PEP-CTERM sorting domain-containing protein [Pseudoduganella albidiflava]GGY52819.1 hypothetical protein GCM10007387_38950 [Pseudoduganella albidiflava]